MIVSQNIMLNSIVDGSDANEGLPSATQSKQSYVRKAKAEKKKSKKPEQDGPTTTEPKPITISEALLRPESDSEKRKGKN